SPTGRFVAYFHLEPGENLSSLSGLYTLDLRTGTRKLLYPMLPNTVSWSPDETHLVFGDGNGLRTIRIDGESVQTIHGGGGGDPQWSPDGQRIGFVEGGKLWTLAIGDTIPIEVPLPGDPAVETFAWCANGREIVASLYVAESNDL